MQGIKYEMKFKYEGKKQLCKNNCREKKNMNDDKSQKKKRKIYNRKQTQSWNIIIRWNIKDINQNKITKNFKEIKRY